MMKTKWMKWMRYVWVRDAAGVLGLVFLIWSIQLTPHQPEALRNRVSDWVVGRWKYTDEYDFVCNGFRNPSQGIEFATAFHCVDTNDNRVLDEEEVKRIIEFNHIHIKVSEGQAYPDEDLFVVLSNGYSVNLNPKREQGKLRAFVVKFSLYGTVLSLKMDGFYMSNKEKDVWWIKPTHTLITLIGKSRPGMSGSPIFEGNRLAGILIGGDGMLTFASSFEVVKR